jgi:hypothetical protein
MNDAPDPRDAARALLRKYRRLSDLRRARAGGEPPPDKRVFRALAQEFPGALNELDTLPLAEIDRRIEALLLAEEGGAVARWIPWMDRYHALMRAALYVKIRVARRPKLTDTEADALAARASRGAGSAVSADFVRAVQAPPNGRLNLVVFGALASAFGASADEIRGALFPRRAPRGGA